MRHNYAVKQLNHVASISPILESKLGATSPPPVLGSGFPQFLTRFPFYFGLLLPLGRKFAQWKIGGRKK